MIWNSRVLQNGSVILLEETPSAYIWRPIAWPPKTLGNVDSQHRIVLSKLVWYSGLLLIKTTNCPKNSFQMKGLDRSHSDRLDTNDLIHQTVQMAAIPPSACWSGFKRDCRWPPWSYGSLCYRKQSHPSVRITCLISCIAWWTFAIPQSEEALTTRSDLSYFIGKDLPASTRCWQGNDTPWIRCKLYGAIFGFASTAYTTTTFLEWKEDSVLFRSQSSALYLGPNSQTAAKVDADIC